MAQLSNKIKEYAKANGVANVDFLQDVLLQDDGQGAYIKEWNLAIAQPTEAQLIFQKTTNNSTYSTIADSETSIPNTDGGELNKGNLTGNFLVDITDTTNDKVKFLWWLQSNACTIMSNGTTADRTIIQFLKLADT